MAASQKFVTANTPMGATLVEGGATFRVWAPRAAHVYVARGDTSAYQAACTDAPPLTSRMARVIASKE